jgi:hypothetical protein
MNRQLRKALRKMKNWFRLKSEPESPEDPYSYVGAPKKPKTPSLSAAAVAELPES